MTNPVGLPSFNHIDTSTFQIHLEELLQRNLERIDELLTENHYYTWDNLIYPLEDLADALERLWSPLSHLHAVMDSPELRACYQACLPQLSAYDATIGHNKKLYEAILSIDPTSLNPIQKKLIDDNLRDFELSGVALSDEKKKRFEAIQTRLTELSNQFDNHVLDATQAFTLPIESEHLLKGLPAHAKHAAKALAEEKGLSGYVLTLDYPCFQAVITHAEDRSLREKMYYAFVTRASNEGPNAGQFDNTQLIDEIISLRQEKAELLGFEHYTDLSLATKMAENTEQVLSFLNDLVGKTKATGKEEFEQLVTFAKETYELSPIQPWDIAYLSEQRRKALFDISQEELRPYFQQPKVFQGLITIVNKLYGMRIEEIHGVDVWHKDVQCFCVVDEHNQIRGYIYTDLYARPNKRGGAWMDSMQSRRKLIDGSIQHPIATLSCNFAKPTGKQPGLLSHEEVQTLFHEFGHCLHHVLTQVDYLEGSGINGVEWDAVELPSQFFENWCWDKESLHLITEHIETHAPLPDALYDRLIKAKNFQSALFILRQMEFALFDFRVHQECKRPNPGSVSDLLNDVRNRVSVVPIMPYNRFQHSFSHIFSGGYAAGYYSYMWAEVLSCDAFDRFEKEGIFNPQTGKEFLTKILEVGGSKPASSAFQSFRGRPATIDALLRHNGITIHKVQ